MLLRVLGGIRMDGSVFANIVSERRCNGGLSKIPDSISGQSTPAWKRELKGFMLRMPAPVVATVIHLLNVKSRMKI